MFLKKNIFILMKVKNLEKIIIRLNFFTYKINKRLILVIIGSLKMFYCVKSFKTKITLVLTQSVHLFVALRHL